MNETQLKSVLSDSVCSYMSEVGHENLTLLAPSEEFAHMRVNRADSSSTPVVFSKRSKIKTFHTWNFPSKIYLCVIQARMSCSWSSKC